MIPDFRGCTLENGATIIDQTNQGTEAVVLAHWRKGEAMEFITWVMDREGSCFWGQYHRNLFAAMAGYKERLK